MQRANDAAFSQAVLSAPHVLVEFWGPWCRACRSLDPALEQFDRAHGNKVLLLKVNSEEAPSAMRRYGVRGLPTLLVFRHGRLMDSYLGNPGSLAALEGLTGLR